MRNACLAALTLAVAYAQNPPLWGDLQAGPYGVGFKASVAFDSTRTYGDAQHRPILLSVWYPALPTPGAGFAYEQYLRVPDVIAMPSFRVRLANFTRQVVCNNLFHKPETALSDDERIAFRTALSTPTAAHADASPVPGPFPVVLYHSGAAGSFEENFVLFEYLASHGYIVVSSAFQSPSPKIISNHIGGIERSGPDLDFIHKQAQRWLNADQTKLAAMGHSAGAQAILQWIGSPNCPARAFVSLDTTMEYDELAKYHRHLRNAIARLTPPRIPVLLFARANPKPSFSAFERYLRHAPRYEAVAADLRHDDFLTHGFLGRLLTHASNAEAVRTSYEEVCHSIRLFLDAAFKGGPSGAFGPNTIDSNSRVYVRYKPPR